LATFIRALHPFGKAYFANNSHFLSPNPYKLSIIENSKNMVTGQVYEVNPKERKISVVCGDNKVLVMKDVRIFGILRIASNIYLRLRIKEGKQLL
ncbi:hypothetical protein IJV79_03040, partial [bacterium]|nr:hypothetical protein [bacterium]